MSESSFTSNADESSIDDTGLTYQDILVEEYVRDCGNFAAEAQARGLVEDEDSGVYADEDGNALDECGERI